MANRYPPTIKPPVGSRLNAGHALSQGLVACWPFNEGGGGMVLDLANNITGILATSPQRPLWSSRSKLGGKSILFAVASQQYINCGVPAALTFNTSSRFTISAWVRSTTSGTNLSVVGKYHSTSAIGYFFNCINSAGGGNAYLQVQSAAGTYCYRIGTKAVSDGLWHHIVGSYDGSSSGTGIRLYVDGIEDIYSDTQTVGTLGSLLTTSNFTIGRRGDVGGSPLPYDGNLDNIRVYNRVLTSTEAMQLFNEPYAGIIQQRRKQISQVNQYGITTFRKVNIRGSLKPACGNSLDMSSPLSQGLSSYWIMNENGGLVVGDLIKNNFGSLGGTARPKWTPLGKGGTSLLFDATDNYVALPSGATFLVDAKPFSISWWEKITADTLVYPSRFNLKISGSTNYFLVIRCKSDSSYLPLAFGKSPNGGSFVIRADSAPTTTNSVGKWVHFVITGTDPNGTNPANFTSYANGLPLTMSNGGAIGTVAVNRIGYDGSDSAADCIIDNVRIYNRALSSNEVRNLYTDPFVGFTKSKKRSMVVQDNQIHFDASGASTYNSPTFGYSWNHTCSGNDRYLVVGISIFGSFGTVTALTYNGVAMTLLGTKSQGVAVVRVEMWGLANPSLGTNQVSVTISSSSASVGTSSSYCNVFQATPTEGFNSASATNVGAADATVNVTTTSDDDWTVDFVGTDDTSITVGTGQTQRNNVSGAAGSTGNSDKGSITPPKTTAMYWTNIGALANWAILSVALIPVKTTTVVNTRVYGYVS